MYVLLGYARCGKSAFIDYDSYEYAICGKSTLTIIGDVNI